MDLGGQDQIIFQQREGWFDDILLIFADSGFAVMVVPHKGRARWARMAKDSVWEDCARRGVSAKELLLSEWIHDVWVKIAYDHASPKCRAICSPGLRDQ
jgi:hypothetical protein